MVGVSVEAMAERMVALTGELTAVGMACLGAGMMAGMKIVGTVATMAVYSVVHSAAQWVVEWVGGKVESTVAVQAGATAVMSAEMLVG